MATFKQRDSGWWQAVIRRKGHPVQSLTFERKSDAEAWARMVESEMDRGVFVNREEAERTTIYDAFGRYEREVTPGKKSAKSERYKIAEWRASKLAQQSLAGLKSSDLAAWRDKQLADGYAASTVAGKLALLSAMYETAAKDWGIHVENPVRKIRKPSTKDNGRERRLVPIEEYWLRKSFCLTRSDSNVYMAPLVWLAVETAARQGELLALQWADVDLVRKVARLRGVGGGTTKNGDEYRDVPLSPTALEILSALPRPIRGGSVFKITKSGVTQAWEHVKARAVRIYMKDCQEKGVVPDPRFMQDLRFHDLRHEGTSRLAERLEMHELAKTTGHKTMTMLLRYYHPRAEDLARKLA